MFRFLGAFCLIFSLKGESISSCSLAICLTLLLLGSFFLNRLLFSHWMSVLWSFLIICVLSFCIVRTLFVQFQIDLLSLGFYLPIFLFFKYVGCNVISLPISESFHLLILFRLIVFLGWLFQKIVGKINRFI